MVEMAGVVVGRASVNRDIFAFQLFNIAYLSLYNAQDGHATTYVSYVIVCPLPVLAAYVCIK